MRTTVIMPKPNYKELTDREIVDLIIAIPHNEEAAYYIIFYRYRGLLFNVYRYYFGNTFYWFDDCLNELFLSLRGAKGEWKSFANFEWRSSLRTWLIKVARNKFLECYYRMIDIEGDGISIEKRGGSKEPVDPNRAILMIELMEAIGKLADESYKFCVIKHLEGYSHKEIAVMLKQKWDMDGTIVYNKKKEIVIPSEGYVNVQIQRAKEELRELMHGLK